MIATAAAFLVPPSLARDGGSLIDLPRFAPLILATSLAGFGLRTASDHVALREREGGRPFFEPDILTEAGVRRGLLFAGTDHAFNLAFDPAARDATKDLVVARSYGDDRDRLVWESHGRPAAYRYVFSGAPAQLPKLIAWEPPAITRRHRYEAEAEWPPLEQSGGYLEPVFATGTCASGQRLLAVHPVGGAPFRGAIAVPVPSAGNFLVRLLVASRQDVRAHFALRAEPSQVPHVWDFTSPPTEILKCSILPEALVNFRPGRASRSSPRGQETSGSTPSS